MVDGYSVALAASTFSFTVLCTAVATTWRVGRVLDERDAIITKLLAAHELSDAERFAEVRREITVSGDNVRHEVGESNAALRQKMHDMEMWGRDNNLQKRSFEIVTSEIKDSLRDLTSKLDAQIIRDARVDRSRGPE